MAAPPPRKPLSLLSKPLSKEEIEDLDYYNFTAYLGIPYFHWGGMDATNQLADLCELTAARRVLVVGCGTGFSACHLAQTRGCEVVGVDVARLMLAEAQARAAECEVADRVRFLAGDAHALPFAAGSFDVVLTEFVTGLLSRPRALAEYVRVLAPGGAVGMNELCKSEELPAEASALLTEAEQTFHEAVGLPLSIVTTPEWLRALCDAGLTDVRVDEVQAPHLLGDYARSMGGMASMIKVLSRTLLYMSSSRKLRRMLLPVGRVKDVLMKNRHTRDHVTARLFVGKKPA